MKPQINRFFERIINMIIDRERVKNTFAEYTSCLLYTSDAADE